ncbi:MAG: virulence-associated E family protein [Ruminococcus flavefaciens]|nr:virulence-associated E family protein [Ruminococcus flavefaciens]
MQYDRKITISAGNNRRAMNWTPQTMLISELWARLQTPARGTEPLAEYLNMKKAQQDDLKDVGGFMAGTLSGPRRKANAVTGRDILTLDLDNIPAGGTEDVLRRVEGLGCGYCIYSTRKHSAAGPRLRVLLPLDRTVSADEYEPLARKAAEYIGMELMDPTTFEVSRLMYWPSCCADSQYIYTWKDRPLINASALLSKYADWRDCTLWPQVPGAVSLPKLAVKQGDPEGKKGVVGAFCRTYDIYRAMDELIPGMYEPVDNMPGRYTYLGGSTTGGAVVYDDGKFLYSHHATDPCSGRLVNAFDLVRLHRFGDKDDEAQPGTPTNRLPSYVAMCELAVQDVSVAALMSQEQYQEAVQDFEGVTGTNDEDPANWMAKLARNAQTGLPKATIDNVWIILEHDPLLKGKFALNRFAGRGEVLGPLPWDARTVRRLWDDNDSAGLYHYMEKVYNISSNGKVDNALSLHSNAHAFNEVQDFLNALTWDGVPRLDTLFVDYLGAADTPYTRAVTRKAFTAAVARAMTPGSKYDNMLILAGPQGLGKSTLLDKMSRGWFNDSIRTFEGKEASELLQGVWLVEISELDAFRRTDVARIKQFLSLRTDRFRAAYGRHVKELPRCCVFFGTTNTKDFLQDRTGNRRFWPVDVGIVPVSKGVWKDLPGEIDQLWAEAKVRWQLGEPLFLSGELEDAAKVKQEEHREVSAREGIVMDFIGRQVPEDWQSWPLDRRRMFWAGSVQGDIKLVDRDRVCALEVWCEALDGRQKDMRYTDTAEINSILEAAAGWVKASKPMRCGYCGVQRGFRRTV